MNLDKIHDQVLKTDSKVSEIKGILEQHLATSELQCKQFNDKIQQHSDELWGKNGTPGLKTDVDRLKTQAGAVKWIAGVVGTVVVERVYSWFGGKKPCCSKSICSNIRRSRTSVCSNNNYSWTFECISVYKYIVLISKHISTSSWIINSSKRYPHCYK